MFNWFSTKSSRNAVPHRVAPASARVAPPASPRDAEANPAKVKGEDKKVVRSARREQLFIAVREAMTRSGVLAASYRFKVLSLDPRGSSFLVMLDVDSTLALSADKLATIEAMVVQTAMGRFSITVTSVYWRAAAVSVLAPAELVDVSAELDSPAPAVAKKPAPKGFEPIREEEVSAFKAMLTKAKLKSPATTDGQGKVRSGPHAYKPLTGFEDTELTDPGAMPALSSTQYGDLN